MKTKSLKLNKVWFDEENIFIETEDGQVKCHPLRWFPRLLNATKKERNKYRISLYGIHWEDLDEDLSVEGFFTYDKDKIEAERNEVEELFKAFPEISISEFARRTGINPAVLRHYTCGIKKPSASRKKEIENALHSLGKRLINVEL